MSPPTDSLLFRLVPPVSGHTSDPLAFSQLYARPSPHNCPPPPPHEQVDRRYFSVPFSSSRFSPFWLAYALLRFALSDFLVESAPCPPAQKHQCLLPPKYIQTCSSSPAPHSKPSSPAPSISVSFPSFPPPLYLEIDHPPSCETLNDSPFPIICLVKSLPWGFTLTHVEFRFSTQECSPLAEP